MTTQLRQYKMLDCKHSGNTPLSGQTITSILDSSGNGFNAGGSGPYPTYDTASNMLNFTGAEVLSFNDAGLPIGVSNRAVDFWFKTADTSNAEEWILSYGTRNFNQWFGLLQYQQKINMSQYGAGVTYNTPLNDGNLHHLVCNYDGANTAIYIDSVFAAGGIPSVITLLSGLGYIGNSPALTQGFIGKVASPRIWDNTLSVYQIQLLYKQGIDGSVLTYPTIPQTKVGWLQIPASNASYSFNRNPKEIYWNIPYLNEIYTGGYLTFYVSSDTSETYDISATLYYSTNGSFGSPVGTPWSSRGSQVSLTGGPPGDPTLIGTFFPDLRRSGTQGNAQGYIIPLINTDAIIGNQGVDLDGINVININHPPNVTGGPAQPAGTFNSWVELQARGISNPGTGATLIAYNPELWLFSSKTYLPTSPAVLAAGDSMFRRFLPLFV